MCFGGSTSTTTAPPPPPPPPPAQLATTPQAAINAANSGTQAAQVVNSSLPTTGTLLTGGLGDTSSLTDKLGKKTLLGQ